MTIIKHNSGLVCSYPDSAVHTPGPWKLEDRVIKSSDGQNVTGLVPSRMTEANARLIAASPELLEGGRLLLRALDEDNNAGIAFHMEGLRASITKATQA